MNKKEDNSISATLEWYRKNGPNPALTALLLAGGTYGLGRALWGPLAETARSLQRPFGNKQLKTSGDWDRAMDKAKASSKLKTILPAIAAAGVGASALWAFGAPNKKYYGLTDWMAPHVPYHSEESLPLIGSGVDKQASLDSYVQDLDWHKPLSLTTANSLFSNEQAFAGNQIARLTGKAIVNDAALSNNTMNPTVGNVFDSALNKIDNKLTLSGVAQAGIRTVVANGAARLFTSALDSVCDLSPGARQSLVDAGTWAGAITSILT